MPWRDDDQSFYAGLRAQEAANREFNRLLDRCDALTKLLCTTSTLLDQNGLLKGKDAAEIRAWYKQHQAMDLGRSAKRPERLGTIDSSDSVTMRIRSRK